MKSHRLGGNPIPRWRRLPALLLAALALLAEPTCPAAEKSASRIDFNRDIRPILAANCYACHGPDSAKRKAGLRLDLKDGALAKLKSDAIAIVPDHPEKSTVIARVTASDDSERMPPAKSGKQLAPGEIAKLRQWISQGAVWQDHWAFLKPVRPTPPAIPNRHWPKNPIDSFIADRLATAGLHSSREADPVTLLRRVTFDLTGLPPTPTEVDTFLADHRPGAYERAVDRLLASPRFGEHEARYWLDVARYGDTHGLHLDNERGLWPYRDWVVRSFNRNLPFDEFTIDQLAGDLLPSPTQDQQIATGFNRCNVTTGEGGTIDEEYYVRYAVDRTETMAITWLGLTVGCAVCHDHKFDPISQKEFYQLYAFFNNISDRAMDDNVLLPPPSIKLPTPEQQSRLVDLEQAINSAERRLREALTNEAAAAEAPLQAWQEQEAAKEKPAGPDNVRAALKEKPAARKPEQTQVIREYYLANVFPPAREMFAALQKEIADRRKERDELNQSLPATMVAQELTPPRPAFVLKRGQYDQRADPVSRNVPAILPPLPPRSVTNRLDLARWLVSPEHPLTARVTVNRFWQQFFGTGIVKTSGDFGRQGEWPSHPELLDWLATEFQANHWDVKSLVRLIVTSATYRQSSNVTPELLARDPQNRLLARGPRFRLDAEEIRDNALFVSGLLVETMGGRSVRPYQPPGIWEAVAYTTSNTAKFAADHGDSLYRRSVYTFWKRTAAPPYLTVFDAPSREKYCTRRETTDTPLQALVTMNDPQYVEAARHLGARMMTSHPDPAHRLDYGFRLVTARHPTSYERDILKTTLEKYVRQYHQDAAAAGKLLAVGDSPNDPKLNPSELAAYTMVGSLLLNLDEVLNKN